MLLINVDEHRHCIMSLTFIVADPATGLGAGLETLNLHRRLQCMTIILTRNGLILKVR